MKNASFILMILFLGSCNKAKEGLQDAIASNMERAIAAQTGAEVDLGDAASYTSNKGIVSFDADGKSYLSKDQEFQAVAIIQKDQDGLAISFQLAGNEGQSLIAIANHIPTNFSLPLTAIFTKSNAYNGENPVATLMYLAPSENSLTSSPMPFEGSMTITKLDEKEMEFQVNARGGSPMDVESPSAWMPIFVEAKLISPIIQSIGVDKNEVLK
tara:strand:+ start:483 stop:1121 length:639 start_codon:yes stop_codon:yes gene_type:complete